MIRHIALTTALLAAPAIAQDTDAPAAPSPGEIVAQAAPAEWIAIAPEDLLVMTLAPDREGKARRVVIQLIPAPFSQTWVENIRTLAKAHWWDGLAIVRVQDNYVVQWGDPDGEDEAKARALPKGLLATDETGYLVKDLLAIPDERGRPRFAYALGAKMVRNAMKAAGAEFTFSRNYVDALESGASSPPPAPQLPDLSDRYAPFATHILGWPVAGTFGKEREPAFWPVHCYGMVGVGRGMSPDAGTGAELYTVIGHAPRHLDRNIAVVGRVVEGIEHLSSLPRGTGSLGFYETPEERVPIQAIRMASELPEAERPLFEFLSTEGETFARYADSRANRRDPFFIVPAGGADICNIPVPVRRVYATE